MKLQLNAPQYLAGTLFVIFFVLLGLYYMFAPQHWMGVPEEKVKAGLFLLQGAMPIIFWLHLARPQQK